MSTILAFALRHYRRHALVFGILVPALALIMVLAGWWVLFWPLMIWLFVFAVHFLVVKSMTVDSEWVDERTAETMDGAYDLDHIRSIRNRYDDRSIGDRREAGAEKTAGDDNTPKR